MELDAVAGRPCARLPVVGQAGGVEGEEDGDGDGELDGDGLGEEVPWPPPGTPSYVQTGAGQVPVQVEPVFQPELPPPSVIAKPVPTQLWTGVAAWAMFFAVTLVNRMVALAWAWTA